MKRLIVEKEVPFFELDFEGQTLRGLSLPQGRFLSEADLSFAMGYTGSARFQSTALTPEEQQERIRIQRNTFPASQVSLAGTRVTEKVLQGVLAGARDIAIRERTARLVSFLAREAPKAFAAYEKNRPGVHILKEEISEERKRGTPQVIQAPPAERETPEVRLELPAEEGKDKGPVEGLVFEDIFQRLEDIFQRLDRIQFLVEEMHARRSVPDKGEGEAVENGVIAEVLYENPGAPALRQHINGFVSGYAHRTGLSTRKVWMDIFYPECENRIKGFSLKNFQKGPILEQIAQNDGLLRAVTLVAVDVLSGSYVPFKGEQIDPSDLTPVEDLAALGLPFSEAS